MDKNYNIFEDLSKPVKEAYKVLRTNIQFCGFDKRIKSIAVTSCNPGEGKTTTAINLCITMAKADMKVLFIDADMRKPLLLKPYSQITNAGLSNLISGYAKLEDVIVRAGLDNFHYIPCGPKPPNPSELISSDEFKDLLDRAETMYDVVIIDTPPLGTVIDCAIISAMIDGTIIVIEANHTECEHVNRAKEQLEKVGATILGVVLNRIDKRQYKIAHKYYNYYEDTLKTTNIFCKQKLKTAR